MKQGNVIFCLDFVFLLTKEKLIYNFTFQLCVTDMYECVRWRLTITPWRKIVVEKLVVGNQSSNTLLGPVHTHVKLHDSVHKRWTPVLSQMYPVQLITSLRFSSTYPFICGPRAPRWPFPFRFLEQKLCVHYSFWPMLVNGHLLRVNEHLSHEVRYVVIKMSHLVTKLPPVIIKVHKRTISTYQLIVTELFMRC